MHKKRQTIKTFWPIPRKGTTFLAVATHEKEHGIPLVVLMREVLKLVKNKNELQKLINERKVSINGKKIKEVNYPVSLFDSISFPEIKKNYLAVVKHKKIGLEEVDEKQASAKPYKIIGKKHLKHKKVQFNLSGGKNILSSEKANVGDFLIINHADNKILKKESLEKGVEVIAIKGKHMGISGKIKEINKEGKNTIAEIVTKDGDKKVNVNNLFIKW